MLSYRAAIPLSNHTLVRLAGGFAIGTTTAWRYVREAVDLVAAATLKMWKVLTRLRCCPRRATAIVQAILVLQLIEEDRYSG
nr:hypothetical protein [Planomonospora sphaerica]